MTGSVTAVDRGSLNWAIRDSLLRYITVIAGGTCTVSGGAGASEGSFVFPLRSIRHADGEWYLTFGGEVRLTAHHGFLDVTLAEPEFIAGPEGGVLTVLTGGQGGRIPVALTDGVQSGSGDTDLLWHAMPAQLLPAACGLFGDAYPAGTELAPVTIRATLDS